MRHKLPFLAILVAPSISRAQLLPSAPAERCSFYGSSATAAQLLNFAASTVLPRSLDGKVLTFRASQDRPLWEQSDRMYEPFIPSTQITQRWYDPSTGIEAWHTGDNPAKSTEFPAILASSTAAYQGRDTLVRPVPQLYSTSRRRENPWVVLADWRAHASDARIAQRCLFRDGWRIVLERDGERLYLSESDGTPIKLERIEPHYLWGQVKAEYMWNTWWGVLGADGGLYPLATFRSFDGHVYERTGVLQFQTSLVPRDSAPRLTVPDAPAMSEVDPMARFATPDTLRVTDNTVQLITRAYTETVTLQRDTIYLLDATTSEARSRGDSAMIAKLFPGRHPMVVVVTDLAWPHISGVRFWVARGATIVSARTSQDFLKRVVDRKWTLAPDALEKSRATSPFKFRAVTDSLTLAGGAVKVYALHGTSTEGAVGVWLPRERYFWAGDYAQPSPGSPYMRDIVRTVHDLSLSPLKLGAQHMKLTEWADIDRK